MVERLTQAEFDAIQDELIQAFRDRKGAKSIAFADQVVTFDTWDEARKFLADLRPTITNAVPRTRYAAVSKGV